MGTERAAVDEKEWEEALREYCGVSSFALAVLLLLRL